MKSKAGIPLVYLYDLSNVYIYIYIYVIIYVCVIVSSPYLLVFGGDRVCGYRNRNHDETTNQKKKMSLKRDLESPP